MVNSPWASVSSRLKLGCPINACAVCLGEFMSHVVSILLLYFITQSTCETNHDVFSCFPSGIQDLAVRNYFNVKHFWGEREKLTLFCARLTSALEQFVLLTSQDSEILIFFSFIFNYFLGLCVEFSCFHLDKKLSELVGCFDYYNLKTFPILASV